MLRIHSDIFIKKLKKCEVELMKRGCSGKAGAAEENQKFHYALRKFRNHRENFAILAKFSLCENFAKLAKFL